MFGKLRVHHSCTAAWSFAFLIPRAILASLSANFGCIYLSSYVAQRLNHCLLLSLGIVQIAEYVV